MPKCPHCQGENLAIFQFPGKLRGICLDCGYDGNV